MPESRPHPLVLGIDDAPFEKGQHAEVPIVGVVMEGATLVEGVALTSFPVDGDGATAFLARWIGGLRWHAAVQAVVLGGVTVAGLGLIDLQRLAADLGQPVLAVTRRDTRQSELRRALEAAGLTDRVPILERLPAARRVRDGLHVTAAGIGPAAAERLLAATLGKANLPEPLRVAHLIGAALVRGASRGRV